MLNRFATLAACIADPGRDRATRLGRPAAPEDAGPPPDNGVVASASPGVVTTPDGWVLTVAATNETQLPVAPLTTAVSSREYLVGGTFTGTVSGNGSTTPQRRVAGGRLPDRLRHRTRPGQADRLGRRQHVGFNDHRRHHSDGRQLPDLRHHRDPRQARHGLHRSPSTRSRSRPRRFASRSRTPTSRSTAASASRSCGRTRR